ncbi:MAG: LamG-like jellyroll fold domain-containing protein [Ignavibacteriaceae bacterium]
MRSNKLLLTFSFLLVLAFGQEKIYSQTNWGNALEFNGVDGIAEAFDEPSLHKPDSTQALTIEGWVKVHQHQDVATIVEKSPDRWGIYDQSNGTILFYIRSSKSLIMSGTVSLITNQWYYVAACWDSATGVARLFINGKIDTTYTNQVQQLNGQDGDLGFGGDADGNDKFVMGSLDEIRISDIVRYDTTFAPPTMPFKPDKYTVALYHMDEGSGITTKDASGNGNDALLMGGYTWFQSDVPTPTGIKEIHSIMPQKFILTQNYPNPFNPTTQIQYSIPKTNFVSLKVYNQLGEEIATLISKVQQPGTYRVTFNGNKLSSGVYFYFLRAGSFSQSKKLILMK